MFVKQADMDKLKQHVEELNHLLKEAEKRAVLIDIVVQERKLKFIFVRNNTITQIETMRLMSDNIKQWKDELIR